MASSKPSPIVFGDLHDGAFFAHASQPATRPPHGQRADATASCSVRGVDANVGDDEASIKKKWVGSLLASPYVSRARISLSISLSRADDAFIGGHLDPALRLFLPRPLLAPRPTACTRGLSLRERDRCRGWRSLGRYRRGDDEASAAAIEALPCSRANEGGRPGPRAAAARPAAVCVRRLPPRGEVRVTP